MNILRKIKKENTSLTPCGHHTLTGLPVSAIFINVEVHRLASCVDIVYRLVLFGVCH